MEADTKPSASWGSPPTVSPWALPVRIYANDDALKTQFGTELANSEGQPFTASKAVFPNDLEAANWTAINWPADKVVKAAYDIRMAEICLLDKDQFAVMLMKTAQEKNPENRRYVIEAKERVNLLKLYAEVRGFTAKDQVNNNINLNNSMTVKFVKSDPVMPTVIDQAPISKSEISNDYPSPIKVKLVSNG